MRLILLFLCMMGISCSVPRGYHQITKDIGNESSDICGETIRLIQKGWLKHEKYNCYWADMSLLDTISKNGKRCMKGKTQEEVLTLFGEPNDKSGTYYYTGKSCIKNKGESTSSFILFITFKEKNGINYVESIGYTAPLK